MDAAILLVACVLLFKMLHPLGAADLVGKPWSGPKLAHAKESTLLLVVSPSCHICSESMPFYQRLAKDSAARMLFAVPEAAAGKAYVAQNNLAQVNVGELTPAAAAGIRGTPTLLLLDASGIIRRQWVGKISSSAEAEVTRALSNRVN